MHQPSGREVDEKGVDFGVIRFDGVALVVEEDKKPHPIHIDFFGAVGIVFKAQHFTQLFQDFLDILGIDFWVRFGL